MVNIRPAPSYKSDWDEKKNEQPKKKENHVLGNRIINIEA